MHKHISKARGSVTKTKTHKDAQAYFQSATQGSVTKTHAQAYLQSETQGSVTQTHAQAYVQSATRGSVTKTQTHKDVQAYLESVIIPSFYAQLPADAACA